MNSDGLLIIDDPQFGICHGANGFSQYKYMWWETRQRFSDSSRFFYDLHSEKKYNTWSLLVGKGQNALNGGLSPRGACWISSNCMSDYSV